MSMDGKTSPAISNYYSQGTPEPEGNAADYKH